MNRDFERLSGTPFDVVVVGGGIHGLFAAYDAAARGLRTALVERDDFGGGITFNHQRTIHGGLRALQSGNIRKCREMIRERRAWARMAPQLVRPLPFLIGTYRGTTRSRLAVRLGFKLFDLIGRDRNRNVMPELHLPKGRLESAAATKRLFPGVAESRLSGGAIWYDYQTIHPDRLTWCVARAAVDAGAVLCNYADVTGLITSAGSAPGVQVRDTVTGATTTVAAGTVILAAGSGLSSLVSSAGLSFTPPPSVRAMNVLLNRPSRDIALAAKARSGRMYTLVPWQGYLLAGTWQASAAGDPASHDVPEEFLADINSAFPALKATRDDVRFVHDAQVPATMRGGTVDLLSEPIVRRLGTSHVIVLVGVKYTTARLAAERAVNLVSRSPSRTGRTVLPGADVTDADGHIQEVCRALRVSLDRDVQRHLASWYGAEAGAVVKAAAAEGGLDRLGPATPVMAGEIPYAARQGAVVHLADIVFRRTALASAGAPGADALTRAADLAAQALGWSASRTSEELADVRRRLRES